MRLLSEVLLSICKELIDDARIECSDLAFKDICLEILAKARLVLTNEQFEQLVLFVTEIMENELSSNPGRKIRIS